MTATAHAAATAPVLRTIHPGDTEESCSSCRYFTGHTSWCKIGKAEAVLAAKVARPARRVNIYTAPAASVIGSAVRVNLWEGARYGTVEAVENGRTVVRFPEGSWAYGPSGRITVR
jgi:hypothetical protein